MAYEYEDFAYDFEDEIRPECMECTKKEDIVDACKYWTEAIVDHLVGPEASDIDKLFWMVEELAHQLDVKIPVLTKEK